MRLLVDGSGFLPGKALGAETYFTGLMTGFADCPSVEVSVVCHPVAAAADAFASGRVEQILDSSIPSVPWRRVMWARRALPRAADRARADIVFFPFNIAHRVSVPSVVMLHDLVDVFYTRNFRSYQPLQHWVRARLIRSGLRHVHTIVTPSHAVAGEVKRWLSTRKRVVAIHEAVDLAPTHQVEVPTWSKPQSEKWLLVPTFCGPHKNVTALVRAFAVAEERASWQPGTVKLIFTGGQNRDYALVEAEATRLGIRSSIQQMGFLTRNDLYELYRTVDGVAYPSLYEGFGLPIVEAVRAGRPLLVSDIPVFREVAGDRASYFRVGDQDDFARGLAALVKAGPVPITTGTQPRSWSDYAKDLLAELTAAAKNG